MGLKGSIGTLQALKQNLRALPTTVAASVAERAAPAMTGLTQEAFASGQSVYGDARPASTVDGHALTLHKSGRAQTGLRFVSVGTIVRCVFSERYVRYLIGKYGVLPNGGLPSKWRERLGQLVSETKVAL